MVSLLSHGVHLFVYRFVCLDILLLLVFVFLKCIVLYVVSIDRCCSCRFTSNSKLIVSWARLADGDSLFIWRFDKVLTAALSPPVVQREQDDAVSSRVNDLLASPPAVCTTTRGAILLRVPHVGSI